MALRVAINGFGRIGRCVARIAHRRTDIDIVAINDLNSAAVLAHLLEHDSVHRKWDVPCHAVDAGIQAGDAFIRVSAEADPAKIPWKDSNVDVVLECTGHFTKAEKARKHLEAGASRVIISAPATEEDLTVCLGVNDERLDLERHFVISNASCTTNCLAPVAKVLNDAFGITAGLMTTVHSYTNDQHLLDLPHRKGDLRRARAAALNMVPTSSGAAKAVGLVLPELKGKLHGMAIRVPTPNVSVVDLTFNTSKPITKDAVNAALSEAAATPRFAGILSAVYAPLVSQDILGSSFSSVVDLELTTVLGEHMGKVFAWYDNEWGYSTRMVDLCARLAHPSGAR